MQRRILKELRELAEFENLDPKESEESRTKFQSMMKWSISLITGEDRETWNPPWSNSTTFSRESILASTHNSRSTLLQRTKPSTHKTYRCQSTLLQIR